MTERRLPPYAELRELVLKGQTYAQLADTYGVTVPAVSKRLSKGASLNGHPWPLLGPEQINERRKREVHSASMPVAPIRMALEDYIAAHPERFANVKRSDMYASLAAQCNISGDLIQVILAERKDRIRKRTARAVLSGIGEEPHPSIAFWVPRHPKARPSKAKATA